PAGEQELMRRHKLLGRAVLSNEHRDALLSRNLDRLVKCICRSPYAKALGDEAKSIITVMVLQTARLFNPAKYRNPTTGRPYTTADIGNPERDRLFRNYMELATKACLAREVGHLRREEATDFTAYAFMPLARCLSPEDAAELNEMAASHH